MSGPAGAPARPRVAHGLGSPPAAGAGDASGGEDGPKAAGGKLGRIVLAGVVLVSAGAVAAAFNPAPHTGGDNAGYVALAYSLIETGTYTELFDPAAPPHTKYPPVFPALLAGLMLLGVRSWTGLKLVAAVSTVAAVAATYLWAERRAGRLVAAGVALALALSSAVVYYSHWILSDPTFLAFTMAALWALDRAQGQGRGGEEEDGGGTDEAKARAAWLSAGVILAGLAYFTRSAGLPLVVALLGWLALERRWRALAASALALGAPALLWWLRASGAGGDAYVSEFWMVDPYRPELGTVGAGGLAGRVVANLRGYVGRHVPGGVVGDEGTGVALLGIALFAAAAIGWARSFRERPRPSELFAPLYLGLLLLWPEVWSGDRFALPLLPLLFTYGVLSLLRGARRLGEGGPRLAGAAALLVVLLPAIASWTRAVQDASACAAAARASGPFACYGPGYARFVEAAAWARAHLPEGASALVRKPRTFYVLSGVPARTFPFDRDAGSHLGLADALGARYALLDEVDGLSAHYVGGALQGAPGAYCAVRTFGEGDGIGTHLIGILPPGARGGAPSPDGTVRLDPCPAGYQSPGPGAASSPYPSSSRIPLLDGLDP